MVSAAPKEISDFPPSAFISGAEGSGTKPELRILQVFNSLGMGGAETWLMALLRYFQQAKDELPVKVRVDVLLTGGARTMFDDEAESLGARLFYSNFTRKNIFRFTKDFRRILAEGRYHAVHDHQDYSAGLRFMIGHGRLPAVKVAHVHNTSIQLAQYNSSPLRRFTFARGKRFLARSATHVTSTSQRMLTEFGFDDPYFNSISRSVVHCGFDVSRFRSNNLSIHRQLSEEFGWDDDVKILLFVGRLEDPAGPTFHRKRPDFALEVARVCIAEDSKVRMIMAGSGELMRTRLEGEVTRWGLEDKIRLTGIYDDVARLMIGSDLFLFPPIEEGLGMVVVEAQAAGLRVLTSMGVPRESMVVPEIVEFKPLEDGVSSWAKETLRLLDLPRPDSGACNSAVRNSAFSIQNSAKKLLEIYRESPAPVR